MGYIQSSHNVAVMWSLGLMSPESGTKTNDSQPLQVSAISVGV